MARPRISVDYDVVLHMRDSDNLGWSRMAEAYRKITGQFVSRDTIKRRYQEAKTQQTKMAAKYRLISLPTAEKPQLVFERVIANPNTIELNGQIWVKVKKNRNL